MLLDFQTFNFQIRYKVKLGFYSVIPPQSDRLQGRNCALEGQTQYLLRQP